MTWYFPRSSPLKLRNGTSKYIFKKMAEEFVPREIVYRRKHGFGVPVAQWFRGELRDLLHEQLTANDDGARLFEPRVVQRMLDEHTSGRYDWSTQLWPLFVFRLWHRRYAP
jgi:asparagine synthase (glutamine-hydrolysing)